MNKDEIFNNIHSIDDLNKAIEQNDAENNRVLQELDVLEEEQRTKEASNSEYEIEKARLEQELLRIQETTSLLATTLQNYNRVIELYDILSTTRRPIDFRSRLQELNELLATLPTDIKIELEKTHVVKEEENRVVIIKTSSIQEVREQLDFSLKETDKLHKELELLEESTENENKHPNMSYINQKAIIDLHLANEKDKQAMYQEIIDAYEELIEAYENSVKIKDEKEYKKFIKDTNKLLNKLPEGIRKSVREKYAYSEELKRIIKIDDESRQELQALIERTERAIEQINNELADLETTRGNIFNTSNFYTEERKLLKQRLKIQQSRLNILNKVLEECYQALGNENIKAEEKRNTKDSEQELIDEIQRILDNQEQQKVNRQKEYEEIKQRIKEQLSKNKDLINKYRDLFSQEINDFKGKDLDDDSNDFEAREEQHLDELDNIKKQYQRAKNAVDYYEKLNDLYNNKANDRRANIEDNEELTRQLQEHLDKRNEYVQQMHDLTLQQLNDFYNQLANQQNSNKDYSPEQYYNQFKSTFGPEGPIANIEKQIKLEDEIINQLKDKLNNNNVNKDYTELQDELENDTNKRLSNNELDDDLLRQLQEHLDKRNKYVQQLQDLTVQQLQNYYNQLANLQNSNKDYSSEEYNKFNELFGPEGPIANIEKQINEEDKIINQLKDKLNNNNVDKDYTELEDEIENDTSKRLSNNEIDDDLQRQLQEHIEKRNGYVQQLQDVYNKLKELKDNEEKVTDLNSLFGPEGPLANLEKLINEEDEIIDGLKDKLNNPRKSYNEDDMDWGNIEPTDLNNIPDGIENGQQRDAETGPKHMADPNTSHKPKHMAEPTTPHKPKHMAEPDDSKGPDEPTGPVPPKGPDEPTGPVPPKGPDEPTGPVPPKGPDEPTGPVPPKGPDEPTGPVPPKGPDEPTDQMPPRSLNTILADIITNPETNEPVNITRSQRLRAESSKIQVRRSFMSEVKNGNIIYNILSIAPAIIHAPINFFRKITGKILTTRRTKENLRIVRQNLDNLSASDLEVLETEYLGNTAVSERGMVGVDGLIQERIQRYRYEKIELKRAAMQALYQKVLSDYSNFRNTNELLRTINERRISEEELNRLMAEYNAQSRNHLTRILKAKCDEYLHGKAAEIKQIRELRKEIENAYSSGLHGQEEDLRAKGTKMNERGRRFAKDVSTEEAYDFTRILGQLQDAEMDAIARGDDMEAMRTFIAIEKKQVSGKEQRRSIFGWRETGLSNYQPVPESLDYRPDPFVRNLLTTISIAGLAVGAVHEIQNRIAQANANANAQAAQDFQNQVAQHNQANRAASQQNMQAGQQVHSYGQEMSGRADDIASGMRQQTSGAMAGNRSVDEYADLGKSGFNTSDPTYLVDDPAHHAAIEQAASQAGKKLADIQSRLATGQITDVQALREMQSLSDSATQQFVEACNRAIPISKQYAAQHPEFAYDGYIEQLERFASDPTAIHRLNEAAVRSVEIGQELQGVNIVPYEELAATLQYLPVNVRTQLFALGSAALLTGGAASQAQYLRQHGAQYNDDLTARIQEIDREDRERREARTQEEVDQMLDDEEEQTLVDDAEHMYSPTHGNTR